MPRRSRVLAAAGLLVAVAFTLTAGAAHAAPGEITGDVPTQGGIAAVLWGGGHVEQIRPAAIARGCAPISAWVAEGGVLVGYIFGAPAFANAPFLAGHPGGDLVEGSIVILLCQPAPIAPPSLVEPVLSQYLPTAAELTAYRAAVEQRDAGEFDLAAAAFADAAALGGPLAPIALLRHAQMLASAGRDDEAAVAFDATLAAPGLPPSLAVIARLSAATVLQRLERDAEALALLAQVTAASGASTSQVALAGWRSADIRREAGDPGWTAQAITVVASYPSTLAARDALDALEAEAIAVPPLAAGLVRYRHRQNAAATALFSPVAATGAPADAAFASFYLGALAERAFDPESAIDWYLRSIELAPAGPLADDAHWWVASLLEDEGLLAEAALHLETLANSFPASSFAADAAIHAAALRVALGGTEAAVARLQSLLAQSTGQTAARAARWLRLLGRDAPDPLALEPRSLFAILDHAGESADQPLAPAALAEWLTVAPDWTAAAAWMQVTFGPPLPGPSVLDGDAIRLALGLAAAGEPAVARTLLLALVDAERGDAYDLLALARLASAAALYDVALVASEVMLGPLSPAARLGSPLAVEQLSYPAPFAAETLAAAQAEGIPPLLLLALVRQESAFHPEAGSSAGAFGLTQVIPSTGQEIAASLGVPWDPAMLADPATSLRFGAHYLARQLTSFDGDLFGALAAYNAGPGSASRWYARALAPGADWYFEAVDFPETRLYLELVVENYAWYRYLYAGTPRPAIR